MKKVALLLATLMVISLLPMATFAADLSSADGLTITAIDNGASTDVTAPLTDTLTYSLGVGMLMYNQNGAYYYNDAKSAAYVYAFAKNTNDKILEFNWNGGKAVRRVDLWVNTGAPFATYEIQIKDGDNWVKHAEGTMVYGAGGSRQCDYHALLFDPIPETSTALRVVMKGCTGGELYIGEARISDDNNYNLIAYGMNADDFEAGRMNGYNKSSSYTNGSKYYSGVVATNALFSGFTAPTTTGSNYLNAESMCRYFSVIWPCALNSATKYYLTPNANGSLYYAVNFSGRNPNCHAVKVNRVKVSMNAGSAEGFDVYVDAGNGLAHLYGTSPTYNDANTSEWTKVASYEGTVTGSDWTTLDIPNSVYNGQWMVVFKNPSADAQVANIEMYQMAEDELGLGEEEEDDIDLPEEYILAIDNGQKTIVTEPLSDGITYSLGVGMLMYNQDGNYWYNGAAAANYVHKFEKDTNNKTLEFKWVGGKAMRRLDLWVSTGAPFATYEIQIKDGDDWVKHAEGTMVYGEGGSRQCDYHALLFDPIPEDSTTLRVVMKGVSATDNLYIGEARLSDNNDYNLIAYGMNEKNFGENGVGGIMNVYNKQWDNYKAASKYSGVVATNALVSGISGQTLSGNQNGHQVESTCRYHSVIWAAKLNEEAKQYITPNTDGSLYYAVNFAGRTPNAHTVKVNRVRVNMNTGSAKGFDVYVDNGNGMANLYAIASSYAGEPNTSEWTKVASYDGTVIGSDWATLDIPATASGGQWMVVFKDPSDNAAVANIEMYRYAEAELASGIKLTGEVAPGETVKLTGNYTNAVSQNVTVMFGLYEGNKLVGIANGGSFTLNGKGQYVATYTIPEEGVAAEGLTVKAFLWNNLNDLQPLQAPITLAQ